MFKPGDRVICIDDTGQNSNKNTKYINKGRVYIVEHYEFYSVTLVGIDIKNGYAFDGWKVDRFHLEKRRVLPVRSKGNI